MEDRRSHPRTNIRSTVLLKNETHVDVADVLDISAGGVRLSWAGQSAREGATLQITFRTACNRMHTSEAEIVRVRETELGMRFRNALPEEILEAAIRVASQGEATPDSATASDI
ncbi:MAG: PilZ domain-containing protein [Candidatus Eremiobacteraeota bacterium]|nr:PilZ domain-containing protein [Candidatus Eremiobacteraeota bacterium]